jgi:hypothetical protein
MSAALEKENAHLREELAALKKQVEEDGWFKAGMEIAKTLSNRIEVKSSGIVNGVADLIRALDRQHGAVNAGSKSALEELRQQLEFCTQENQKLKKKRDYAIALLSVILESEEVAEEDAAKAEALIASIGSRALILAKKAL